MQFVTKVSISEQRQITEMTWRESHSHNLEQFVLKESKVNTLKSFTPVLEVDLSLIGFG